MSKRKKIVIVASVLLIVIVLSVAVFLINRSNQTEESVEQYYSQLTGVEVSEEESNRPILGVMIENSEAARPQTGLDSAGIVFEAVTEGGITRYLAFYQEDTPDIVGPVRSVRPHFVDWIMGFDASAVHVGGSKEALDLLEQRDAKSLNQFNFSEPYYRDDQRSAPHNMYVRVPELRDLQREENHDKSEFAAIPRSDDSISESPQAPVVEVNFSSALYNVEFRYDESTNTYVRYLAGEPHIDAQTDEPITVKNVVVLKANGLSNGVEAIGNGDAIVFKDGNANSRVSWEKDEYSNRVLLKDEQGNELPLNRGDTWFIAIAEDREVTF